MKKLSGGLLLLAATMIFTACGNDKSTSEEITTDSSTAATADHTRVDTSTATTMDMNPSTPNGFAMTAADGGMMEVELAKIAQQKAASKEVKDFAKMIEQDHTKANDELKGIASGKHISLPVAMSSEHQMHINDMNAKTGADFDKAYINMMVENHNKGIAMFKDASENMADAELKSFATKTLPTLQKHLDKAKEIQGKMK